ncbi:response regulator transcription factor [Streptomyces olivaceoviridis]|uniref:response regulator transcription factor n=1 Tax=Streptomyces olivaceoviridis TaxID=1921 RepID=UPI0036FA1E4D
MIVDDSPHFLEAARRLLEGQGITVVGVASDGAQAMRLIGQLRPEVVLMDIDLGAESGLELTRRLRDETGPSPPLFILVSNHAEEDYGDVVEESTAVGFLAKSALSGDAIRTLLTRENHQGGPVIEPQET